MPTTGQLALLIIAVALFAIGGAMSVAQAWQQQQPSRTLKSAARACMVGGILACLGVIVWHAAQRRQWLPIGDNFDALVWLATLLALFVVYVQSTKPLGGLDWFVMPVVVVMLVAAVLVGRTEYHPYVGSAWDWVHRVTAYGGAVAFAISAAAGTMYVITSRRLRRKAPVGSYVTSLERLEHVTMVAVTLGFALLTVGAITGGVTMLAQGRHTPVAKVVLASAVWLVYAVVLHAPINPSFRGRKVAVLSVVGFLLMVGTIATVLLMPGGAS